MSDETNAELVRVKTTITFESRMLRGNYGDWDNERIRRYEENHALEAAEFAIEDGRCVVAVEVWSDTAPTDMNAEVSR